MDNIIPALNLIAKGYKTQYLPGTLLSSNKRDGLSGLQNFYRSFDFILDGKSGYKRSDQETVRDYFRRLICPIPDLLSFYSRNAETQSDDYFMEITFARAKYAYHRNDAPVAASIVKDGKVIVTSGNKGKLGGKHAEEIAIERAKELFAEDKLEGSKMYITLGPCGGCHSKIREGALWISDIIWGLSTTMMDFRQMRVPKNTIYGRKPRYRSYHHDSLWHNRKRCICHENGGT